MDEIKKVENENLKNVSGGQDSDLAEEPSIDLVTDEKQQRVLAGKCKPNCMPDQRVAFKK